MAEAKILKMSFLDNYSWGLYETFRFMHVAPTSPGSNLDLKPVENTGGRGHHSCREFFINSMRYKYTQNKNREIFTGRTYILVGFGEVRYEKDVKARYNTMKRRFHKSLNIINCLEREYAWPMSKIFLVKNSKTTHYIPSVLFVGSGRWNTSPYMLSLYTLLIRGCSNSWVPAAKKTWPETRDAICKEATSYKNDGNKILRTINYWHCFVKHHSRMWAGYPKKWWWANTRLADPCCYTPEGIHKLCTGTSKHNVALKRFTQIKIEEGKLK